MIVRKMENHRNDYPQPNKSALAAKSRGPFTMIHKSMLIDERELQISSPRDNSADIFGVNLP